MPDLASFSYITLKYFSDSEWTKYVEVTHRFGKSKQSFQVEDREAQTADANHDSDIAMHSLFPSIAFKTITVSEQDLTESESQLNLFQKHP